jgi:hypothetical protein
MSFTGGLSFSQIQDRQRHVDVQPAKHCRPVFPARKAKILQTWIVRITRAYFSGKE